MRSRYVLLFASLAAMACSPAPSGSASTATGTAADEAALRDIANKYAAAFNARDTKMMSAIMAADYQEVEPMGMHLVGRDSVIAMMASQWSQMPPAAKMTATTSYVRFLSATSAVAGGTYSMAGAPPGMAGKGAWMASAVKQDSTWVIVSSLAGDAPPEAPAGPPAVVPTKPQP